MGQPDGIRQQGRRVITGKTEHGHLVAGRDFSNFLVRELLLVKQILLVDRQRVGGGQNAADLVVEILLLVADAFDHFARDSRKIHFDLGAETGRDKNNRAGHRTLGPHPGLRVLVKKKIHDGIADPIAKFIVFNMSLGD